MVKKLFSKGELDFNLIWCLTLHILRSHQLLLLQHGTPLSRACSEIESLINHIKQVINMFVHETFGQAMRQEYYMEHVPVWHKYLSQKKAVKRDRGNV